jgi:hypothetical protein
LLRVIELGKKGFYLDVFKRVEEKLLILKFNLEAGRQFYGEKGIIFTPEEEEVCYLWNR